MPADIARRLVSNQGMHVMRMLLTTIALSLCVGLLVHAQTGVDFSGNWILESQATADTATALSVRQSLVSTNVRGEPMKPHFRDIAIDREVGGTTRSEGHGISRTVHGTPESVRRVLHREGLASALGGNPYGPVTLDDQRAVGDAVEVLGSSEELGDKAGILYGDAAGAAARLTNGTTHRSRTGTAARSVRRCLEPA
jgi:hypothetical protein